MTRTNELVLGMIRDFERGKLSIDDVLELRDAYESELARKDAALREAAKEKCEGCRLSWKFSDGWRHTEPMPIICEAQAIRSALTAPREEGETK